MLLVALVPAGAFGLALFFLPRAVGNFVRHRFRAGLGDLGRLLSLFLLALVLLFLFSSLGLHDSSTGTSTEGRARALGEFVSESMNLGAWLGIVALGAGLVDTIWWAPKRSAPNRSAPD